MVGMPINFPIVGKGLISPLIYQMYIWMIIDLKGVLFLTLTESEEFD
jgi:hypothetical protein